MKCHRQYRSTNRTTFELNEQETPQHSRGRTSVSLDDSGHHLRLSDSTFRVSDLANQPSTRQMVKSANESTATGSVTGPKSKNPRCAITETKPGWLFCTELKMESVAESTSEAEKKRRKRWRRNLSLPRTASTGFSCAGSAECQRVTMYPEDSHGHPHPQSLGGTIQIPLFRDVLL